MRDDFDRGEDGDDEEGRTVGKRDATQPLEMAVLIVGHMRWNKEKEVCGNSPCIEWKKTVAPMTQMNCSKRGGG